MHPIPPRPGWGLLSLALLVLAATLTAPAASTVRLQRLPGGGVQPDAVLDDGGVLHLVFLQGDPKASDVLYVRRPMGQTNLPAAQRVNSQPGSAVAVGTIRGAQIALGRQGRVHVVWNGSSEARPKPAESAPMLYSRLNDAGDGFEPQRNLVTATVHLDGGGSVAADGQGNVFVAWHAAPMNGPRGETNRSIFLAASTDDGRTFAPERSLLPGGAGVCACCALETLMDAQGRLHILYRSATAAGTRDLTWLRSDVGTRTFASLQLDPWRASACPMSSMILVRTGGDGVLAAWETRGQVHRAQLQSASLEATQRHAPAGGVNNRKHPVVATRGRPGDAILMAWAVGTGWQKGGSLAWEITEADGTVTTGRADGLPVWGRPAAVAEADGSFTLFY